MKLWLDDVRPAPEGYVLCRSVQIAIVKIENAENIVANAKYAIADYETNYKHTDSPLKENYEKYTIPKLKQNIANYQIELIDVDHDLGDYARFGGGWSETSRLARSDWSQLPNTNSQRESSRRC